MSAAPTILSLNAGSSSLRFALFRHEHDALVLLRRGLVEEIDSDTPDGFQPAVARMMDELAPDLRSGLGAVGHRVVHGGTHFTAPVLIGHDVLTRLRDTIRLAPKHQPGALAGIAAMQRLDPALPQVACFDTAFHQAIPELARRLPLPDRYWDSGLRRYGFHGLSYEHLLGALGPDLPARTIFAHLGNGSSMVALHDGRPVDTTMGFTPNSGLVMGSRCGDLEPGVVLHLLRDEGLTSPEVDRLLHNEAGLRGVSGLSSDMRTLLAEADHHEGARRAIALYCHAARKHIGALTAVLGGLDLLVFTGGIGEHAAPVREAITQPLRRFLSFQSRVVATDEEHIVAAHTAALLPG